MVSGVTNAQGLTGALYARGSRKLTSSRQIKVTSSRQIKVTSSLKKCSPSPSRLEVLPPGGQTASGRPKGNSGRLSASGGLQA